MSKKISEKLCFFLIIIIIIIIGYCTYKSYDNKKNSSDNNTEINNFYNVDYLFNNSYIDIPKTIENFSSKKDKIYVYLDASNIMYIKNTENEKYSKKVTGIPEGNVEIYYNQLYDEYYEFLVKVENDDIYYSFINLNSKHNEKFTLIGSNINKVYVPFYDKSGVYVNKKEEFATKFILYDSNENLKYIDINNKKQYVLKSDINSKKPYFDYICASNNDYICNKLMIYITFNNELIYDNESIKNIDGNEIHVKDIFSSFHIKSKQSIDINKITEKSLQQYEYLFSSYIIDENKMVYQFDISNNNKRIIPLNNENNKVKEYVYENDEKLTIVFEDNTQKTIKADKNTIITTSTIYDKSQSNNKIVLIQP